MYEITQTIPDIESYLRLREIAGLSPRSREAAELGLPNSLFAVSIYNGDKLIGMGRIVGDGGCNFEVVDIAVNPQHQGQGLGRQIMENIMAYLNTNAPAGSYISLIADVPELYEKFGFKKCSPKSEGMYLQGQA
jgi:ribosomal protein S18 acetylase RimI-like enzyme